MGHAHYQSSKAEQAAAYRAQLKQELRSFLTRETVQPQSHRRVLKVEG